MASTTEPMLCECGNKFARAYYVDGTFIGAQIGGLIVQTVHGNCVQCRRGIHIQVSSKEALKLFSRYGVVEAITVEITEEIVK